MAVRKEPTDRVPTREQILSTLDPDADNQRWYTCDGCGWPCINPVGTIPERRERCLDCATEQYTIGDF
jgi:hypothetical protein